LAQPRRTKRGWSDQRDDLPTLCRLPLFLLIEQGLEPNPGPVSRDEFRRAFNRQPEPTYIEGLYRPPQPLTRALGSGPAHVPTPPPPLVADRPPQTDSPSEATTSLSTLVSLLVPSGF